MSGEHSQANVWRTPLTGSSGFFTCPPSLFWSDPVRTKSLARSDRLEEKKTRSLWGLFPDTTMSSFPHMAWPTGTSDVLRHRFLGVNHDRRSAARRATKRCRESIYWASGYLSLGNSRMQPTEQSESSSYLTISSLSSPHHLFSLLGGLASSQLTTPRPLLQSTSTSQPDPHLLRLERPRPPLPLPISSVTLRLNSGSGSKDLRDASRATSDVCAGRPAVRGSLGLGSPAWTRLRARGHGSTSR